MEHKYKINQIHLTVDSIKSKANDESNNYILKILEIK